MCIFYTRAGALTAAGLVSGLSRLASRIEDEVEAEARQLLPFELKWRA